MDVYEENIIAEQNKSDDILVYRCTEQYSLISGGGVTSVVKVNQSLRYVHSCVEYTSCLGQFQACMLIKRNLLRLS